MHIEDLSVPGDAIVIVCLALQLPGNAFLRQMADGHEAGAAVVDYLYEPHDIVETPGRPLECGRLLLSASIKLAIRLKWGTNGVPLLLPVCLRFSLVLL